MTITKFLSLVDVQAKMALRADASRYMLGYVWWILEPLLYVCVFYVVFDVILDSKRADFLAFLMCGKLMFIWFSKTVTMSANSIVANAGLIGKMDLPKALFPMAIVQECLYRQAVVVLLLLAFLSSSGYDAELKWFFVIPVIVVQYLVIVLCGLVASVLVCFLRDFSMLIPLAMTFLLFTSGIFWDVRALNDQALSQAILIINPIAFLLDAYRQILLEGEAPDWLHLGVLGATAFALVTAQLLLMRRISRTLALKALTA